MTVLIGAELLLAVADAIEANPDNYNQEDWIASDEVLQDAPQTKRFDALIEGSCGTTACVAGWCVAINAKNKSIRNRIKNLGDSDSVGDMAAKLLWPLLEQNEADELFQANWRPLSSKSVSSALRKIAKGKRVSEV